VRPGAAVQPACRRLVRCSLRSARTSLRSCFVLRASRALGPRLFHARPRVARETPRGSLNVDMPRPRARRPRRFRTMLRFASLASYVQSCPSPVQARSGSAGRGLLYPAIHQRQTTVTGATSRLSKLFSPTAAAGTRDCSRPLCGLFLVSPTMSNRTISTEPRAHAKGERPRRLA
jgi:hypothetical protein